MYEAWLDHCSSSPCGFVVRLLVTLPVVNAGVITGLITDGGLAEGRPGPSTGTGPTGSANAIYRTS